MRHARVPREGRQNFSDASSVNDNVPGMLAGHEMSDLTGVPRQPAPESSVHYSRVSQIDEFPDHPVDVKEAVDAAPDFAIGTEAASSGPPPKGGKVFATCIGSFLVHAVLFYALAVNLVAEPQEAVEEAGAIVSVTLLGNAEFDEMAAGDSAEEVLPEPEVVEAEQVQPEQVQPVETAQVQPAEMPPVETVMPQPTVTAEPVEQIEAEPVATLEPQVLMSEVPAEPVVSQPITALQPMEEPPAEMAEVQPVAPVEKPIEPEPEKTPETKKPPEKPKAKEIKEAKPKEPKRKPKSGSKGEQKQDNKRGDADGQQSADSVKNGSQASGRRSSASGSAAVANYPGKVQAKIRRSVRVPTALKRKHAGTSVLVRLTIGSSGSLTGVSVARSSGVAELDRLVVDGVRRASPFPPLPAGKSTWSFTQPVQITR
ncbi:TonB family protein [Rhizobiaceae bacterium n13]|uniref:TonB family protein n=1 Tax=Ferirhizobium litorale TaxID=2927786 RepID=A0AAE3QCH4_9HYPH|nr:TonB family protein [Fererhizobium litorale]MDI7860708.1 TonB family protein [Fererhizobium litorale]MDI7920856.1 TonB family protein [Fererhizobium litorale]